MLLSSDIRHGRHCVFQLNVHLVFVTKYRHRVLDGDAINRLRAIFSKVCADFEAELVEMDGEDNHVHLLVNYPAKHSIATLLNSLKGVSSSMLRRERPDLRPRYCKGVLFLAVVFCRPVVVVLRLPSSRLTSSSKRSRFNHLTRAYIPALQGEVLGPHG